MVKYSDLKSLVGIWDSSYRHVYIGKSMTKGNLWQMFVHRQEYPISSRIPKSHHSDLAVIGIEDFKPERI